MSEPVYQWAIGGAVKARYRVRRVRVAPSREAAHGPHYRAEVYEPSRGWTALLAEPGVLMELVQLVGERDHAIAHDRQPYPTADAYEKACAALAASRERVAAARAALASVGCWSMEPAVERAIREALAALGEEAKDGE